MGQLVPPVPVPVPVPPPTPLPLPLAPVVLVPVVPLLALLALLPGLGCATAFNLSRGHDKMMVYGGTQEDVSATAVVLWGPKPPSKLPEVERAFACLCTIDLPFSVVADTITLPITVPVSIYRHYNPPPPDAPGAEAECAAPRRPLW